MMPNLHGTAWTGDPTETGRLQERPDEPPLDPAAGTVRMGVYAIRNTLDGAMYVGSTTDIDRRWGQHRAALDQGCHASDQLQTAWIRDGAAAFAFIVLEHIDDADALARAEQRWIDRYAADDLHHVYNSQTRVIRKCRKRLTLDEAAERVGRTAAARKGDRKGLGYSMPYLIGATVAFIVAAKLLGLD